MLINITDAISIAQCKTAVSPLLTPWRYYRLALSYRYGITGHMESIHVKLVVSRAHITRFYYSIYAGIFLLFRMIFDSIYHVGAFTSLCHKIYTLFPTDIVYIYVIAAIVFTMIIFCMLFIAEQWLSQAMLLVACNRREAISYHLSSSYSLFN